MRDPLRRRLPSADASSLLTLQLEFYSSMSSICVTCVAKSAESRITSSEGRVARRVGVHHMYLACHQPSNIAFGLEAILRTPHLLLEIGSSRAGGIDVAVTTLAFKTTLTSLVSTRIRAETGETSK